MASLSPSPIDTTNWVAPLVMQYLGVRSLVRFSSLNGQLRAFLAIEVMRRKNVIRAAQEQVNELLHVAISDDALPTRDAVNYSEIIASKARRLIDNELHWLERKGSPDSDVDPLFADERRRFESGQFILPLCFSLSLGKEIVFPNDEDEKRVFLVDAENMISQVSLWMRDRPQPSASFPLPLLFFTGESGFPIFRYEEMYNLIGLTFHEILERLPFERHTDRDEMLLRFVCRHLASERPEYISYLYLILE